MLKHIVCHLLADVATVESSWCAPLRPFPQKGYQLTELAGALQLADDPTWHDFTNDWAKQGPAVHSPSWSVTVPTSSKELGQYQLLILS